MKNQLLDTLRGFIKESVVVVETPFISKGIQGQNYSGSFRTIIHLDGDVLCIVPSPEAYPQNPEWIALLDNYAERHTQSVAAFLQQLNIYQTTSKRLLVILGNLLGGVTWLAVFTTHYHDLLVWLLLYNKHVSHPFWVGFNLGIASVSFIASIVFMLWLGEMTVRYIRIFLIKMISRKLRTLID
ncbi:hypothetical protein [Beggiatoa leptomitoformis]|uniref:Uncharacterized protein n=1 Tax=Beggiatoa leptomitoformis TaxID=288004 RepID=A0A2N9YBI1_9GAMM|nr:hypothetical protein [Beggiatoa leptomitoformis]ALG66811.1 hypothetical protein AL038_02630 [Beggiatoa leptomitoformis]AUI67840.1 hypothetical protein BLE401_03415 [Beggiatoa leptomitoformis]